MTRLGGTNLDTSAVEANLRAMQRAAPAVQRRALRLTAEAIGAEAASQQSIPIKTGALQGSHTVQEMDGGRRVRFGFNIVYAAAVHERHPTKPGFLVNAITRQGQRIARAVMRRVFAESRGGRR